MSPVASGGMISGIIIGSSENMLDDRIKARMLDDHKKPTADGKLLSREPRAATDFPRRWPTPSTRTLGT